MWPAAADRVRGTGDRRGGWRRGGGPGSGWLPWQQAGGRVGGEGCVGWGVWVAGIGGRGGAEGPEGMTVEGSELVDLCPLQISGIGKNCTQI